MTNDIFVYCVDLPRGIREMVTPCEGGYTIYIHDGLGYAEKAKVFRHAIRHIERNDFEKHDVQSIESEAHAD